MILATNFRRNLDDAFVRRLDFVIDFPFPDAEDRERIWKLLLPDEAPLDEDVDVAFLAERFKLSGGAIRNCSLSPPSRPPTRARRSACATSCERSRRSTASRAA